MLPDGDDMSWLLISLRLQLRHDKLSGIADPSMEDPAPIRTATVVSSSSAAVSEPSVPVLAKSALDYSVMYLHSHCAQPV